MEEYTKLLEHSRRGVVLNGRMILKRDKIPNRCEDTVFVLFCAHFVVDDWICGSVVLHGLRPVECVFMCAAGRVEHLQHREHAAFAGRRSAGDYLGESPRRAVHVLVSHHA